LFFALGAALAVLWVATASVSAAPVEAGPVRIMPARMFYDAPEYGNPPSRLATPITCTLSVTTTADSLGNNSFASAAILASYSNLTLAQGNKDQQVLTEDDYFRLDNAIAGLVYIVDAIPVGAGNYNLGLVVYNSSFTPIITDAVTTDNNSARVQLQAPNSGPFYFVVSQLTPICGGSYNLTVTGPATPTPTATHTATPTGSPTGSPSVTPTGLVGADRFEPNFDFDRAALIALNLAYTNLNFVPWAGSDPNQPDNDFYKLWAKPGELITCETLDLSAYTDTNLIVYDNNRNGIAGNDDINRNEGNLASRVSFYSTYLGWLYILIGNTYPIENPSLAFNFTYTLQCVTGPPPTPTPTNTRIPTTPPPTVPTNTPTPSITPSPTPSQTPTQPSIQVRPLPTATPLGQPPVARVPINLQVYYDLNNNRSPDPGEGVIGVSARVVDVTTGQELASGLTDEFGFASFTVEASGVVRLVVPYFNESRLITSGASVALRIAPYGIPITIP
jgi:hypothetical protein